MTRKEITLAVRPLRETIEETLDYQGQYRVPAPVMVGPFRCTASVTYTRGVRSPFQIWYQAERAGVTEIKVSSQSTFTRLLAERI